MVAKETFLRDRVAAVSNRVGNVVNGQRLLVLEHGRRFLKVKTDKNEIGWIEEHGVIDQDTFKQFDDLDKQHAKDPVVATAVLRDDLYLHVKPGRQEDRFYLLPEGDKLQLLVRASVPKVTPPQAMPIPVAKPKVKTKTATPAPDAKGKTPADAGAKTGDSAAAAEPPALEDWWLIRDSQGKVGWMLSRRLDVDVPDTIAGYSEGQRIVGAYKLTTVSDPESSFPNGEAPEYVTVTSPYKDGLPYDFNQARIFIWNTKKHRYETAYRVRNIEGYLPVTVTMQAFDKVGTVPVFSFKAAADDDSVAVESATGAAHAANTTVLTYRLEGAIVRKVEPAPPPAATTPAAAVAAVASTPAPAVAPAAHSRRARHRAASRKARRESHPKHHKHP